MAQHRKLCFACGIMCNIGAIKVVEAKMFRRYSIEYLCPECYDERMCENENRQQ